MRWSLMFAIVLMSVPASAQEWFSFSGQYNGAADGCTAYTVRVPSLEEYRNTRISVTFEPDWAHVWVAVDDSNDGEYVQGTYGATSGVGGYLEIVTRLSPGPANDKEVCIGREDTLPNAQVHQGSVSFDVTGTWAGNHDDATATPTASDWTGVDAELWRELVFDAYENPDGLQDNTSFVLPYPSPQYYIQLGGPQGCGPEWRMTLDTLHYWRAVIPIVVEQVTGVPYRQRVHAGCTPREEQWGWVVVKYIAPWEYHQETDKEWGENSFARARVGHTRGKIWFRYDGSARPLDQWHKETIAHEIGHSLGLRHTGRTDSIMNPSRSGRSASAFHVLTPAEETVARRGFWNGRNAKYCDDQMSKCTGSRQTTQAGRPGIVVGVVRTPPLVAEPPAATHRSGERQGW